MVEAADHLDNFTPIISGLRGSKGYWFDSHFSWNNVDPNDSAPVCLFDFRPTNPDTPGAPLLVTGPWRMKSTVQRQTEGVQVWRFAHTYVPPGTASGRPREKMFHKMDASSCSRPTGKTSWKNTQSDKYRTDVLLSVGDEQGGVQLRAF